MSVVLSFFSYSISPVVLFLSLFHYLVIYAFFITFVIPLCLFDMCLFI